MGSQAERAAESHRLGPFPCLVNRRLGRPWGSFTSFALAEPGREGQALSRLPIPDSLVSGPYLFSWSRPCPRSRCGEGGDARSRRPNPPPLPPLYPPAPSLAPQPPGGRAQLSEEGGAGRKQVKEVWAPPLAGDRAVYSLLETLDVGVSQGFAQKV